MLTIYNPNGEECTCEQSQLQTLLDAGYTLTKPEVKVAVKKEEK